VTLPAEPKPFKARLMTRCHSNDERIDRCVVHGRSYGIAGRRSPSPLGKGGPCQAILEARDAGLETYESR
jgi:hypothetical protein